MQTTTARIYTELGLRPVVNAAGKMTYLGSSACTPAVAEAIAAAAQGWVDMAELSVVAGRAVADATGAEAGLVTSCAAAGLAVAAAGCITGGDQLLVEAVPDLPDYVNRRVVLQKGHSVSFGAPLATMLRIGGARADEIGSANRCEPAALESALRQPAAALYFVVSHHVSQAELIDLPTVIRIAHDAGVPVVVDAAAETDLRRYVALGADLVVYSGHKAIGGPTSGLVCGRADLVAACAAQGTGIGRAMKIGKESIVGLLAALRDYDRIPAEPEYEALSARTTRLLAALSDLKGVTAELALDPTRPIPRVRVHVDAGTAGMTATELAGRLAAGTPSVRCRTHHASEGHFDLDPRTLTGPDEKQLAEAFRFALNPQQD